VFDLNSAEQQSTRKLSAKLIIGILFIPFIFAWFTLEKGYRPVARIAAFSWLTLNLLLLVTDSGSANWGIMLFLCGAGMLSAIWFGKWRPWISVQNIADRVPQKSVDKSQVKVGPVCGQATSLVSNLPMSVLTVNGREGRLMWKNLYLMTVGNFTFVGSAISG